MPSYTLWIYLLRSILLVAFVASATSTPIGLPTKSVDISSSSTGTSALHQTIVAPSSVVSTAMDNNGSKTSGTILLVALATTATTTPIGGLPENGFDISDTGMGTGTVHPQATVDCSTIVSATSKSNSTILVALVASVASTPTPTQSVDISNSSTGTSAVDTQSTVGSSTVVSVITVCNGSRVNSTSDTFVTPQLSGVLPRPTQVLIPQLDNSTTVQQPTPTAPSVPVGFNLFMESGGTPSLRVILCIVIAIMIFLAAYLSMCCFSRRCSCRSQPQLEPQPLPPPQRISVLRLGISFPLALSVVRILLTSTATPTSSQRRSSSSDRTLTPVVIDRHHNEPSSSRYSAADGGPNNPRLSSNSDTTVVNANNSHADNKSAMDLPTSEPRPNSAFGGDSAVAGVEMVVLPVVVRPPAVRHATRHTRPRVAAHGGCASSLERFRPLHDTLPSLYLSHEHHRTIHNHWRHIFFTRPSAHPYDFTTTVTPLFAMRHPSPTHTGRWRLSDTPMLP
ncbi:hypothetical protein B0H14DRAFT_115136 [Mycena olivaceomarginata]|nr:hypothetical protein B0H14DRAFT_115136 [Mycena olivaceomarginata]